jgi:hypothetical protein
MKDQNHNCVKYNKEFAYYTRMDPVLFYQPSNNHLAGQVTALLSTTGERDKRPQLSAGYVLIVLVFLPAH